MVLVKEIIYLKKKNGKYVINLDENKSTGYHWIALNVNDNNVKYSDSFGFEHIPKEITIFIGQKNITTKQMMQ